MLRYDGAKYFVSDALLKRDVAALLPKHAKPGALEGANKAFARNAGQSGHAILRFRRMSRKAVAK
jgi:hypothetical protein